MLSFCVEILKWGFFLTEIYRTSLKKLNKKIMVFLFLPFTPPDDPEAGEKPGRLQIGPSAGRISALRTVRRYGPARCG